MRAFVSAFVGSVAWAATGLPGNALVIDDFEEGPFALASLEASQTLSIESLSHEHVVGGVRRVTVSGLGVSAGLSLSPGEDGAFLRSRVADPDLAQGAIAFTYANLGGVDLTAGGADTLLLAASGPVEVTIDGQTQLTTSGSIPLTSFDQIDPSHVDEISIELALGSLLPERELFDVRTTSAAGAELARCEADLGESNLALSEAKAALAQCIAGRPFLDTDGDGEENARDACADTPAGAPVDADGCSQPQFCAERALTCTRNDWRNDEPTRRKPGDCSYDKRARTCS
jgi:hypothetical protein